MFKVTRGKGVHIEFANGYGISIQWGLGNYCENKNEWGDEGMELAFEKYAERQRELGEAGSRTAEIAVLDADGEFCGQELGLEVFANDEVAGWCTPARVLEVMVEIAALPEKEK